MKLCSKCRQTFSDDLTQCPTDGTALRHDPLLGATLGSYRVDRYLAEGGLGVVYVGEQTQIRRPVAVKVIKREFLSDANIQGRFFQEARAIAKITHPHLIDIFDLGTTPDGRVYYVMELLEGRTLGDRMQATPLAFAELATLVDELLAALEVAHGAGIVHRDLKPDNLFLVERPGEAPFLKVLDFGVAKVLGGDEDAESRLTRTGNIIGTPQYMAPEQIEGGAIDHRADLYAVGVILYELATRTLPFRAQTLGGMLKAHLLETPPRFDEARLAPGVPIALEAVVWKAMAKDPAERYASARELREDLERVRTGQPPRAPAPPMSVASTMPGVPRAFVAAGTTQSGVTMPGAASGTPTAAGSTMPGHLPPPPKPNDGRGLRLAVGAVGVAIVAGIVVTAVYAVREKKQPEKPAPIAATAAKPPVKKAGPNVAELRSRALSVLTAALKDGDPAVRKQSLEALAQGRDARHATLVEPLLDDADLSVRAAAAATLASLGAQSAMPALRRAAASNARMQLIAGDALIRLGDTNAARELGPLVKKGDDDTRLQAALVVGPRDKEARHVLEKAQKKLASDDPRRATVLARLAVVDPKARELLAGLIETAPGIVQVLASESLARLGDDRGRQRLASLASDEQSVSLLAYRSLATLDDQTGFDVFKARFSASDAPLADRVIAANGLGASGERSVLELLGGALGDAEPSLRVAAAGAILGVLSADPKAMAARSLEWATAALNDSSWMVRAQAVSVLGDAGAAAALPLLGKAIHDEQPEVRRAAAGSLGRTKVAAAVPLLGEALDDATGDVRMTALRSLGSLGDKSAQPVIKKHLKRASAKEKIVAAGQLAKLGDESEVEELKVALTSPDAELRRLALEEAAAAPKLAKDATETALKDKDSAVRVAAALQVADRKEPSGDLTKLAVPILQDAIKRGGVDAVAAFAALGKLGVKPAHALKPETLFASNDAELRLQAVDAALRLAGGDALPLYRRALDDTDPRVRLRAVEGLGDHPSLEGDKRLALLKRLSSDADAAVRAKAGALFARLAPPPPPEPAAEAPSETPPAPVAAAKVDLAAPPRTDLAPVAVVDMAPAPVAAPAAPVAAPPDMAPNAAALAAAREEDSREEAHVAMAQGELALKAGRLDAAIRELQRARKLNPKLPVYFSLGEAHRKLGDRESDRNRQRDAYGKAIEFYKKAVDKRAAAYAAELAERLKEK